MKITINSIEGKTSKRGSKQNKTYTVVSESQVSKNFYNCIDDKGVEYSIWNVNGDWSKLGIYKNGVRRCSYTTDFTKED